MSPSSTAPVLVTGATGKQGGATVHALIEAGIPVRAFVRDPKRGAAVERLGAELAVGDLHDRESVIRAAQGARGIFSVQMPSMSADGVDFEGEMRQAVNLIEAAKVAGVQQLVHTSVSGAGQHSTAPGWAEGDWGMTADSLDAKSAIQDRVRAAGLDRWTILKPGTFMENFLPSAAYMFPRGLEGGLITALRPDTHLALVAVEDIGRAAAAAFANADRFHGVELELASDYRSMTQIAETLSHVLGLTIPAPDMSEEQAVEAGMPAMGTSHRWLNAFGQPARPEYAHALGIPTTSFEAWAWRHLGATS
ncbi:NmrA family NAD(P)-binding protein [Spiractinospora alimapuensis]|uniref:NmrA family NAD(P)-binding protein n=1 Tax=Spiractinospora alimapuensis TaxID=2820884 RepID=UPI001F3CFE92|nr:NmrA family NAD(P)-binding protein [Spiractinospora alimapuensis]QVQ51480.1 NmrA family NAD(P)-binding protein [Spiractinospora alimapuensis]